MNDLGDRMKSYEHVSSPQLLPRTPVVVRIDGRAFHSYTSKAVKPFDNVIINTMLDAAEELAKEMQGFKLAYVQSDEASFLLSDFDNLQSQGWFGY